jgi:predicted component of type VI protein secretion system
VVVPCPDRSVSSSHLLLEPVARGWTATDLSSTNGSMLIRDGDSVALHAGDTVALISGDMLKLGDRTIAVTVDVA